MSLEDELTHVMIENCEAASREIGYRANRHLQAIKRKGGLARAKDMLRPRTKDQRSGLDRLLEANRPDLSVEALVIDSRFQNLFTTEEQETASRRLEQFAQERQIYESFASNLYPDDLPTGPYPEGAKKTVRVNRHERNLKARRKCIDHYGCSCVVCGLCFTDQYGELGEGFIHVHHLMPMALTDGQYKLDPIADLRPVCPNCHAMLHRGDTFLSIEELRQILQQNR